MKKYGRIKEFHSEYEITMSLEVSERKTYNLIQRVWFSLQNQLLLKSRLKQIRHTYKDWNHFGYNKCMWNFEGKTRKGIFITIWGDTSETTIDHIADALCRSFHQNFARIYDRKKNMGKIWEVKPE